MSDSSENVTVHLLDREYLIACAPGERDSLVEAARLLDQRMREVRSKARLLSLDRVAVLAALNLGHEFLLYRNQADARQAATEDRLQRIGAKLEALVARSVE